MTFINASKINSGTYSGDGTTNRAIAHGLRVVPKVVIGVNQTGFQVYFYGIPSGQQIFNSHSSDSGGAVTNMDSTNFYVGLATSFLGNVSGQTVYWTAIG